MPITEIATIIGLTVLVIGLIAGVLGFRPAVAKVLAETQSKVIDAQREQIDAQDARLKLCEDEGAKIKRESSRMKRELYAVRLAMKDLGYFISLEDDTVSIYDVSSRTSHTSQIRPLHKVGSTDITTEEDAS